MSRYGSPCSALPLRADCRQLRMAAAGVRRCASGETSAMSSNGRLAVLGESICPYCGVGCRLRLEGAGGKPQRVRGVEDAPANRGGLCAKGALLAETLDTPDRLTHPQFRLDRQSPFRPTDWDTALRYVNECL